MTYATKIFWGSTYFLFLKNCTVDVLQTIYYDAFFNIFFDQIRKQESGELKQIWKLHTEWIWEAPQRTFIILTFQLQDGDFALKSAFTIKISPFMEKLGPHFLCWILGVVSFNTWLISSWEENKCCYKLRKYTKWHLFHSKWLKLPL